MAAAVLVLIGCGMNLPANEQKTVSAAPQSEDSLFNEEDSDISLFEQAVEIIKKYETLHKPQHWPLIGYGHKVLPGEKYNRSRTLSEQEADALLRKDLLKNCAVFREFGADSLLLGVLAYNIGSGATLRSGVVKKLKTGDRDIRQTYLAHCRYRGKVHGQIKKRRTEEFDALFIDNLPSLAKPEAILQQDPLLSYADKQDQQAKKDKKGLL